MENCLHTQGWIGEPNDYICYKCKSKISNEWVDFLETIWKGQFYIQNFKVKHKLDFKIRLYKNETPILVKKKGKKIIKEEIQLSFDF